MRYYLAEAKIVLPWGVFLLAPLLGILRLTQVVSPEVGDIWTGWLVFLEFVFPLLLPLLVFNVLEQDKRGQEALAAAPRRKSAVYLVRTGMVCTPVFLIAGAAVRPEEYLFLLAPAVALGGLCLLVGIAWDAEVGLTLALGWWGASIAAPLAGLDPSGITGWLLLVQGPAALVAKDPAVRKVFHLILGSSLHALALLVADRKRTWTKS